MPDEQDLDRRILAGHAAGDAAALAGLYNEAAVNAETGGHVDRACFFYTQAYTYALDAGDQPAVNRLRAILVVHGREM
jgi:hypothetical protein